MSEAEGCKKRVYATGGSFSGHRCGKKVKSDGLCGRHTPEAEAKRTEKSRERSRETMARWTKEVAMRQEAHRCAAAYPKLVAALREIANAAYVADHDVARLEPRSIYNAAKNALAGEPEVTE